MAGPDFRHRQAAAGLCLLAAITASACSSAPTAPKTPAPAAPAAAAPTPAPEAPVAGSVDPHRADVVVIDAGDPEVSETGTSLADTARAERQRRAGAAKPLTVINDKNLKQHASRGQISIGAPAAAKPALSTAPTVEKKGEEYWRSRVRDLRHRWKLAEEAIERLSGEAEGLKRRFYSADDPYLRDAQIKPDWDRTLDLLRQAREDSKRVQGELEDALEEGRRAGALPGWLREGIDDEPAPPVEEAPPAQAIEPIELKEGRP